MEWSELILKKKIMTKVLDVPQKTRDVEKMIEEILDCIENSLKLYGEIKGLFKESMNVRRSTGFKGFIVSNLCGAVKLKEMVIDVKNVIIKYRSSVKELEKARSLYIGLIQEGILSVSYD